MKAPFKFSPSDFTFGDGDFSVEIARQANARLEQWLAEAPTVFSLIEPGDGLYSAWDDVQMSKDTHRAKLVCIEPIKKGEGE